MKRGLTLVEVLIAIAVIVIGLLAMCSVFYSTLFSEEKLSSRFVMLKLAEGKLEELLYGINDSDFPASLPTEVVFSGSEGNIARLPSYLAPDLHSNAYNGISYSCIVDLSTVSTSAVLIRVKVFEKDRPTRFVELVGVRPR